MEFKTGQKVLCVNDSFRTYCAYPLRKGSVYTIQDFYKCACGSNQVTLLEKPFTIEMKCRCNRISFRRQSFFDWRFIPLEYFEKFIDFSDEKTNQKKDVVHVTAIHEEVIKNIYGAYPIEKIVLDDLFMN